MVSSILTWLEVTQAGIHKKKCFQNNIQLKSNWFRHCKVLKGGNTWSTLILQELSNNITKLPPAFLCCCFVVFFFLITFGTSRAFLLFWEGIIIRCTKFSNSVAYVSKSVTGNCLRQRFHERTTTVTVNQNKCQNVSKPLPASEL